MALKAIFDSMKRGGYIVGRLDRYLLSLSTTDSDRAIDVNAPSQLGTCLRARYYARTGTEADPHSIDGRLRRIFDNGTHVHIRLQEYLKAQGMLLIDEVPVLNPEFNIQGHTDGILKIGTDEKAVLEIKSIKSGLFAELKQAKPQHKMQGLIYCFCLEERRKALQSRYEDLDAFLADVDTRRDELKKYYGHLTDGSKFTADEKIEYQLSLHAQIDEILYLTKTPITKAVFLYENKDTQELKEYTVSTTSEEGKQILKAVLDDCAKLNKLVQDKNIPPREGTSKACTACRWCNYKIECWV